MSRYFSSTRICAARSRLTQSVSVNSTNRISSRSDTDWNSICKKTRSGNNFRRCGKEVIRLFRRICALAIIICILCGGACGCEKDTGPVGYTQDEERVNKLRYQAEQRKKFAGSDLHDHAVDLTRNLLQRNSSANFIFEHPQTDITIS